MENNDEKQADALSQKIIALLNDGNVSQFVALIALTDVLQLVLTNIRCKECRALACDNLSELVPDMIDSAMEAPGDGPGDPGSHHIH
jgi:hypothetical protein